MNKVNIVIDLSNQVWRSYHATKNKNMINDDGMNVGFIIGFINLIYNAVSLSKNYPGIHELIIVEDRKPTRKQALYTSKPEILRDASDTYKGKRHKEKLDYDIISIIRQFLGCIPHTKLWCDGEEADDVIATFVHNNLGCTNIIFSTDKDLWQMFDIKGVVIVTGTTVLTKETIAEKFDGGTSKHVILHKCIRGDAGDNIMGIKGFQLKKILPAYLECDGTLNGFKNKVRDMYGNCKQFKQIILNRELLALNKRLVKLNTDVIYNSVRKEREQNDRSNWVKLCSVFQVPSLRTSAIMNSF